VEKKFAIKRLPLRFAKGQRDAPEKTEESVRIAALRSRWHLNFQSGGPERSANFCTNRRLGWQEFARFTIRSASASARKTKFFHTVLKFRGCQKEKNKTIHTIRVVRERPAAKRLGYTHARLEKSECMARPDENSQALFL